MRKLLLVFICCLLVFSVCGCGKSFDNKNDDKDDDENSGGTLKVYNGQSLNLYNPYYVNIYFNDNEVFSGSINLGNTVENSTDKNVEWKVMYRIAGHGYATKIGKLSNGDTVLYRLGD
jgi:hypothetical protein